MIVLTFDTDYLWEEDILKFVEMFPFSGEATYFLWQPFLKLDLGDHELAPHPLLSDTQPWLETIRDFHTRWGQSGSTFRAHSCVYSHLLGAQLAQLGYTAVSQATPLYQDGLRAYRHPWGIWELPIYYMESMDFTMGRNWSGLTHTPFDSAIIARSLEGEHLYVYAFHPLHVLMNISSYEQYQSVRHRVVSREVSPGSVSFGGRGSRTFFEELLNGMHRTRLSSHSCRQIVSSEHR